MYRTKSRIETHASAFTDDFIEHAHATRVVLLLLLVAGEQVSRVFRFVFGGAAPRRDARARRRPRCILPLVLITIHQRVQIIIILPQLPTDTPLTARVLLLTVERVFRVARGVVARERLPKPLLILLVKRLVLVDLLIFESIRRAHVLERVLIAPRVARLARLVVVIGARAWIHSSRSRAAATARARRVVVRAVARRVERDERRDETMGKNSPRARARTVSLERGRARRGASE